LTQVAGRAGRGSLPGRVLIQTYYPEHYALRYASKQDYEGFYKSELKFRQRLGYPPFAALASILIKHGDLRHARYNAEILKESLAAANKDYACRVIGPAPAPISMLKNKYRIQILIKCDSRSALRNVIDFALADAKEHGCDMRGVAVEIDPINLM
jgi:primosomal protein N' (replication factor Y)